MIYLYKCWKCNRGPRVEQPEGQDELTLDCRKCGRKLFRCNLVPGIQTDSTFMSGSHLDDGFGADNVARMRARAIAKAAGVNPEGKKYFPSLAKKRYDPGAWMSGRGDIKRRCEQNGWGCSGGVHVTGEGFDGPNPLDEPYECDPAFVEQEIKERELVQGEPIPAQERADLKETLVKKYSGAQD